MFGTFLLLFVVLYPLVTPLGSGGGEQASGTGQGGPGVGGADQEHIEHRVGGDVAQTYQARHGDKVGGAGG